MANDIPDKQNQGSPLRHLAAQRFLYGRAKTVAAIQFAIAVVASAALIMLEYFVPAARLWTAFVGLMLTVLNEGALEPIKTLYRGKAAKVQEAFDCDVLKLPWSTLTAGDKPEREQIFDSAIANLDTAALRDWYAPEVGALSPELGRIVCQRINCFWDSQLRRAYAITLVVTLVAVVIGLTVFALLRHLTLADFVLTVLAPAFPFIMWTIRERREHWEAAGRLDRLRTHSTGLWQRAMDGSLEPTEMLPESRRLQDAIYDHRRLSPLVFGWFHFLLKPRLEKQMASTAADLVAEARRLGRL